MKAVIRGKQYDTETAEAIADNEFSDGTNRMNTGRCTTLYKTKKGNFFEFNETCWQGEHDTIIPLNKGEAKELFENLKNQSVGYEEAFGEQPEEA
jgi:hypothetical protein